MPKLDLDAIPQTNRTGYPARYADEACRAAGTAASAPRAGSAISARAMSC